MGTIFFYKMDFHTLKGEKVRSWKPKKKKKILKLTMCDRSIIRYSKW